ncbi:MerR family transcriptional regulator [Brevibacillus reuszeri]|uniref:MerR family transcriptional regulator n=1 Tax=Brevibacillus reuszeri TaxID=54915 RepID=UPI003D239794
MSKIQQKYFTTSEMAKTCGVTKHTLFHYDEIGLLKPDFVNEKGYRFYSFKQCYTLDIINVLKKAGSSLQEIKDFFQNQNSTMFVNLIQQKQRELELEHLRIQKMQYFLKGAVEMTQTAMHDLRETPMVEECEAQYFITTRVEQCVDEQEYAIKLREHRDYSEKHLILHEFPLWSILSKERFDAENYYPNYIAYKLISPIQTEKMVTRPKGKYAVLDHIGSYESMSSTYTTLKKYINSTGLQVCTNVYEVEMLNYLTEEDPDNFIIRISVGVS